MSLRTQVVGLMVSAAYTAGTAGALAQPVALMVPPPAPAEAIAEAEASAAPPATSSPTRGATGATADARLAEVRERVEAATHSAAEAGLPAAWLLDKVTEGLAKGVPPGQIISAVEHLGERMRAAARIQHDLPPARDRAQAHATLRALVDALSVGAPEAAVAHLARDIGRSDPDAVRASVDAVADLGERGFRGEAAVHAVEVAFDRGGRDGMAGLLVSADKISGNSDAARMQALTAAADRTAKPSSPPANAFGRERGAPAHAGSSTHDRSARRGKGMGAAPTHPGRSPR